MPRQLYDIHNYPQRSGTSQPQRYKPVLMGEEVKIDERTIADFILFAHKFSTYLIYYNNNNIPQGDWQSFLYNDITYHLAAKAADKSSHWQAAWNELMENVEGDAGGEPTDADFKKYFTWRFDFLYSLLGKMMEAYVHGNSLPQWQIDLQALFSTFHLNIIYFLLGEYAATAAPLLVNNTTPFSNKDLVLSQRKAVEATLFEYGQPVIELLKPDDPIIPNGDFILGNAATVAEKITAASEYLNDIANQLIGIYNGVNALAERHLSETLTAYDTHQPHVALFYAYLQLSDEHRLEINGLLLKHLDFYYKQVLCVKEKPCLADEAFVTFELAKNVNEYFIATASLLSAGKDPAGKDVFYKTTSDILVNKTEIAAIRSFVFIKNNFKKNNLIAPIGFFASTAANSIDGKGKPLLQGASWDPFRVSDTAFKNDAAIGISFYAALLHEAPGEAREFALQAEYATAIITDSIINVIKNYGTIKVLTEKEPITMDITIAEPINGGKGFKISFTISGKTKLSKASPNASLIFGNKFSTVDASTMDVFKMFQTERLVKLQLLLSHHVVQVKHADTAAGTTDLSSAFLAFGGVPKVGSSFAVIEPMLLHRTVNELSMAIEWDADAERTYRVKVYYPSQPDGVERVIEEGDAVSTVPLISNGNIPFLQNYIKVTLTQSLGHSTYANDMARAIMEQNDKTGNARQVQSRKRSDDSSSFEEDDLDFGIDKKSGKSKGNDRKSSYGTSLPSPPYTPVIKSIALTVMLSEDLITNTTSNIYGQYAHGIKKISQANDARLIPATPFEGELYIGCRNIVPAQSLKILVQVQEGSAGATLENPGTQWHYLHDNEWKTFEDSFIDDGTRGLIQSGIVSFILPNADTTANTLLPAGLLWLRAAVPSTQSNAVCKIIDIHAQAVMVRFENHGNKPDWLGTNALANTITNLSPKQSAVKKVLQPYPGFGGSKTETPSQLYTRTSERLRHKSRTVNVWDYENVILEQFPEVYKVKTLNHACQLKDDPNKIMAKSGHVLVLVVPKTNAASAIYKPQLSKAKLTTIYEFICPLGSAFAKLSVINPLFQEVQLVIEVSFSSFVKDRLFYENLLHTAVTRFLSPWAFDGATEPEFGGVIYKAAIIDFIEELGYIDFIKRLEIIHAGNSSNDMAKASSPAAILISADNHFITGVLHNASAPVGGGAINITAIGHN